MDFFEAQARAKRRTTRLVLLFVLAVLGTILASYLAVLLLLAQGSPAARGPRGWGGPPRINPPPPVFDGPPRRGWAVRWGAGAPRPAAPPPPPAAAAPPPPPPPPPP